MPVAAPLIIGGLTAAGAIGGSAISASASKTAAQEQAQSAANALDYTKQAEAPYIGLGNTSVAQLMQALQSGQFGPGSLPTFSAPTQAEAESTPGYQFTRDQGLLGINRGAAAAGGAFTGGTLKSLAGFGTGLADSTYNSRFNQAMESYQAQLAKQSQEYQQLITPITIGQNAASGTSTNVANLMTGIGNAQAAGTVGSANAINQGISGVSNAALQTYLLQQLNPAAASTPPGWTSTASGNIPPAQPYQTPEPALPALPYIPG